MLQTLATNQKISENSSATYTYSPQSVQKVFVSVEDADWEAGNVTVQIGSRTICNGINNFGLRMNILNQRTSIGLTLNHVGFQIKSFIIPPKIGINYKPGIWHFPLISTEDTDFLVLDRKGSGENLIIHQFKEEEIILKY